MRERAEHRHWTEHGDAVKAVTMLQRIVIDEADRNEPQLRVLQELLRDHTTGVPRTGDEHATDFGRLAERATPGSCAPL